MYIHTYKGNNNMFYFCICIYIYSLMNEIFPKGNILMCTGFEYKPFCFLQVALLGLKSSAIELTCLVYGGYPARNVLVCPERWFNGRFTFTLKYWYQCRI